MKKHPPAHDAALLVGLLYHGTMQHDPDVLRAIVKDALERAHQLYNRLEPRTSRATRRT